MLLNYQSHFEVMLSKLAQTMSIDTLTDGSLNPACVCTQGKNYKTMPPVYILIGAHLSQVPN